MRARSNFSTGSLRNGFRQPIEVRPGLAGFHAYLAAVGALGGAALVLADAPAWVAALAGAWMLARLGLEARRHARPGASAHVARALLSPAGHWHVETGTGAVLEATLRRCWGAGGGPLIGLEWACADGRTRRAWVLHRTVPPDAWRRLRARLRLA